MNQINNAINGLASSLLLNVGLTKVAEKFDPMLEQSGKSIAFVESAESCDFCNYPCNFTPEIGQ